MADKPICIITPEGLKCLASPLKDHHPNGEDCKPTAANDKRDKRVQKIREKLALTDVDLPDTKQKLIAKLAELILAADPGEDTPFTIVRA